MTTKKLGNKFKSVQSFMGKEMVQLFDGEKGYFDQMGTKTDIPADKIAELKKGKPMDAMKLLLALCQGLMGLANLPEEAKAII